jgi:hypothetical protein
MVGFFGDEWHMVYEASFRQAKGLAEFLYYDGHPLVTWIYALSFRLLGVQPFAWQLYSLTLRWLAVTGFWLVLNETWPARKLETFMTAVFFALYPVFYLQVQAVSYFEIWVSYIILWLSFYFTLKSIREPDRFWLFIVLAILFKVGHVFTSEYTWGTEFMRWFLVGVVFYEQDIKKFKALAGKVLATVWPFLLITLLAFGWRIFFYASPTGYRTDPVLIQQLAKDPLATIGGVLSSILPDMVWILFGSWGKLVNLDTFELLRRFDFLVLGLILVGGLCAWFYTRQLQDGLSSGDDWTLAALVSGAAVLLVGMLPFYVTGNFIHSGVDPWRGRFALGSLPGAALLTTVFFSIFIRPGNRRILLFAIVTGLMVGWQNQAGEQLRHTWEHQTQFYQQLLWRAPSIDRNTAFMIADGDFELPAALAFEVNTVYEQPALADGRLAYWFFSIPSDKKERLDYANQLAKGLALKDRKYENYFNGNSSQALLFTFAPEKGQCLWILTPEMANYASPQLQGLSKGNAFNRIHSGSERKLGLFDEIFGPGSRGGRQSWCYYFEKADLARQQKDWSAIDALWAQVLKDNVRPANGLEYLPFIEAQARAARWDQALTLTRSANKIGPDTAAALCNFWGRIQRETPNSDLKALTIYQANSAFGCQP